MNFIIIIFFFVDNPAYVAVALSNDNKMGDDSAMECVPEGGRVRTYSSWTSSQPNYGASRQDVVSYNENSSCNRLHNEPY